MKLWRAHGLGNVYLVQEDGPPMTPGLARALCDGATGVGSDGVLVPAAPEGAGYGVRIWNPDGSLAEKSGNGLRIFARWLVRNGAASSLSIDTGFDVVSCEVADDVRVQMGRATVHWEGRQPAPAPDRDLIALDVGNPHCVVFVEDLAVPWRAWGAALETHPAFGNRTNVQVARVTPGGVEIRIWERGAGVTPASGSSACAVAAAAVHQGRLPVGEVAVSSPGGVLKVTVDATLNLVLRGPVAEVGTVEVANEWIAQAVAP